MQHFMSRNNQYVLTNKYNIKGLYVSNDHKKMVEYMFPDSPSIDKSLLKFTDEAIYSVSGKEGSNVLRHFIYNQLRTYRLSITDMTANVGSDTIMLALHFKHINSIEYDNNTFNILKHNVNTYFLKNVSLYNGDSSIIINNIKQDVLYMDPPWGGQNYDKKVKIDLFLGEKNIIDIVNENINSVKCIVLKLPVNYKYRKITKNNNIKNIIMTSIKNAKGKIKYFLCMIFNGN